jgi:hypothetical protein
VSKALTAQLRMLFETITCCDCIALRFFVDLVAFVV